MLNRFYLSKEMIMCASTEDHPTPPPKTEGVKPDVEKKKDAKINNASVDRSSKDSFPASDPPSYNSGNAIGAPKERETPPVTHEEIEEAAKAK